MLSIYSLFEAYKNVLSKNEQFKRMQHNLKVLKKRGESKLDKPLFTSPKPGNQRYSKPVWGRFDKEKSVQPYKK